MMAMGDLIGAASLLMAQANHRAELAAMNIANVGSSGYKRRVDFSAMVANVDGVVAGEPLAHHPDITDFSSGAEIVSANPYDLVPGGADFFVVRDGEDIAYTRAGQFQRNADGNLVTVNGAILQAEGGGDLQLNRPGFRVIQDGTVVEDGAPVARIAMVGFEDITTLRSNGDGTFSAGVSPAQAVTTTSLRQGAYEASNVSTGNEMVVMMEALRRAEAGQHLVQLYDELMGRALTAFGGAAA